MECQGCSVEEKKVYQWNEENEWKANKLCFESMVNVSFESPSNIDSCSFMYTLLSNVLRVKKTNWMNEDKVNKTMMF